MRRVPVREVHIGCFVCGFPKSALGMEDVSVLGGLFVGSGADEILLCTMHLAMWNDLAKATHAVAADRGGVS